MVYGGVIHVHANLKDKLNVEMRELVETSHCKCCEGKIPSRYQGSCQPNWANGGVYHTHAE